MVNIGIAASKYPGVFQRVVIMRRKIIAILEIRFLCFDCGH